MNEVSKDCPNCGSVVNHANVIEQVRTFNLLAGNTDNQYNVRQSALYMGLMLEEMAEKLAHLGLYKVAGEMDNLGYCFKRGDYDDHLTTTNRANLLDDDVDLVVVTLGSMLSMGVDIHGAFNEVYRSNMTKLQDDGMMAKDANGKIVKPSTYSPPNLAPFVHG